MLVVFIAGMVAGAIFTFVGLLIVAHYTRRSGSGNVQKIRMREKVVTETIRARPTPPPDNEPVGWQEGDPFNEGEGAEPTYPPSL